jgi:segregation and condensation protein B
MTQLDSTERNIEAILFACGEPIERERLAEALQAEPHLIDLLVQKIRDRYQAAKSALDIISLDGAYQMCTMPQYGSVIRSALELRRGMALSQAALEVLAVVAYNQPVTRSFVEQVRGVDCSSLVRSLTEKRLIEEAGRMNIPGKPIVYRTTANFLRCFGLGGIDQLPVLPKGVEVPPDDDQLEGQIDFFDED